MKIPISLTMLMMIKSRETLLVAYILRRPCACAAGVTLNCISLELNLHVEIQHQMVDAMNTSSCGVPIAQIYRFM